MGNIFEDDIDSIRGSESYRKIATGCSTDSPTSHCANCSYKELSPLLEELEVNN